MIDNLQVMWCRCSIAISSFLYLPHRKHHWCDGDDTLRPKCERERERTNDKWNAEYQEMKKFNQFVFPSRCILYIECSMNWSSHLFLFDIEIFEIIWIFSRKFMWFLFYFYLCHSVRILQFSSHSHIEIGYDTIDRSLAWISSNIQSILCVIKSIVGYFIL